MIRPESALYKDIQPYLDPTTRLLKAPDGGTDNLILFSAYLMRELNRIGAGTDAITVLHDRSDYLKACLVAPGLYSRHPVYRDANSVDNMIGACYQNKWVAADILSRWNRRLACFDVDRPNWVGVGVNWYGRFIGLKAYIKACAGVELTWFDRLLWSLACIWSTYTSKGASDPLMQSLQNDAVPGCKFAKWVWNRKYSVKALYVEYFGPEFPLSKSARTF